jgi:hypothetical protein
VFERGKGEEGGGGGIKIKTPRLYGRRNKKTVLLKKETFGLQLLKW